MSGSQIIAIAGGSGSGKTTFVEELKNQLGQDNCAVLYQDSYYFDQSRMFKGDGSINYDHPSSLDFELMAYHLKCLQEGQSILAPTYCYKTHKRLPETIKIKSSPYILLDGTLILSQKNVCEAVNLKVFIETQEELRFYRRLKRDVAERGRTPAGVKTQFEAHVKPMHDQFIEPSKHQADQVVEGIGSYEEIVSEILSKSGYLG